MDMELRVFMDGFRLLLQEDAAVEVWSGLTLLGTLDGQTVTRIVQAHLTQAMLVRRVAVDLDRAPVMESPRKPPARVLPDPQEVRAQRRQARRSRRRTMKTSLLILMLFALPFAAEAQPKEYWEQKAREADTRNARRWAQEDFARAVSACIPRARAVDGNFDAHVDGEVQVYMIGTERGRYEFRRCMNEQGQAIR